MNELSRTHLGLAYSTLVGALLMTSLGICQTQMLCVE